LQGNFSLTSSVDEGGALPKGSRGFRAPEQMQIGEELSFGPLDGGAEEIKLLKYLDQIISDGDWIRVQGRFKDGTSMTRLHRNGDNNYRLGSPFVDPPQLSKGQLIPDVSLHSDVFALGCLAYFLSSDGRNPERFWRQYLDEVALQALPEWVINSPLWMAAALCIDESTVIAKDLRALWKAMAPERRRILDGQSDGAKLSDLEQVNVAEQHYQWMVQSVSRPTFVMSSDAAQVARFRSGVQQNSALSRLLKDRNGPKGEGSPICFPFLAIVCLCCMRDKSGSVVRRSPPPEGSQNGLPAAPARTYVYATDESSFASRMVDIGVQLHQLPSFRTPVNTPLTDLGESPLDQFMRARLAAPR